MANRVEEIADGLQLELAGDQKMLQELARDFTRKEIIPKAEHYDRTGEWPWDIFNKARQVGLVNINVPEEYGGMGASVLEECLVTEEMAYGCSGIQTALMLNQLAALPLLIAGNDDQKTRYLTQLTEAGKVMSYALTEPDAAGNQSSLGVGAPASGTCHLPLRSDRARRTLPRRQVRRGIPNVRRLSPPLDWLGSASRLSVGSVRVQRVAHENKPPNQRLHPTLLRGIMA